MTDEMIVVSSLDQEVETSDEADEIYRMVDSKIDRAIETGDIRIIVDQIAQFRILAKVAGMSLVRVLGRIAENWEVFKISEPMQDYLYTVTGLHRATIDRYIKVYNMMKIAPPEVAKKLQSQNVKNLIPVGNMVAQGWELEPQDWNKLASTTDYNEISEIVRELKGADHRQSHLGLWMDRSGSLWAFKDKSRVFIGSLEVSNDDPIAKQAIERIIKNSGFLLQ